MWSASGPHYVTAGTVQPDTTTTFAMTYSGLSQGTPDAYDKWNANNKLTNVNCLTGVAKLWYRNHRSDFTSWSDFATALTEIFRWPAVDGLPDEQHLCGRV